MKENFKRQVHNFLVELHPKKELKFCLAAVGFSLFCFFLCLPSWLAFSFLSTFLVHKFFPCQQLFHFLQVLHGFWSNAPATGWKAKGCFTWFREKLAVYARYCLACHNFFVKSNANRFVWNFRIDQASLKSKSFHVKFTNSRQHFFRCTFSFAKCSSAFAVVKRWKDKGSLRAFIVPSIWLLHKFEILLRMLLIFWKQQALTGKPWSEAWSWVDLLSISIEKV